MKHGGSGCCGGGGGGVRVLEEECWVVGEEERKIGLNTYHAKGLNT